MIGAIVGDIAGSVYELGSTPCSFIPLKSEIRAA